MNAFMERDMGHELNDVFEPALRAFRNNFADTPIHVDVLGMEHVLGPGLIADKHIKLTIGEKQIQYYAEIRNNLTRAYIGLLIQRRNMLPGALLLVTNYVNDAMAEYLKENKIEFIDVVGNAYINQPPIYIDIKGNKQRDKFLNTTPGKAFLPTGLKVIFNFLCDPLILNRNYRTIAQTAGVALGNIGWLIIDLKRQGFLLDRGKQGRQLIQKQRLLDRFVEEYPKRLRPQLFLGQFRGDPDWWNKKDLGFEYALWGGEVAAARMGNYLKPQTMTVYLKRELLNEFLLNKRLKRDAHGEVEILKTFWGQNNPAGDKGLVHPILAYADLIATGNQRNIEAARMIYEQDVKRFVRED